MSSTVPENKTTRQRGRGAPSGNKNATKEGQGLTNLRLDLSKDRAAQWFCYLDDRRRATDSRQVRAAFYDLVWHIFDLLIVRGPKLRELEEQAAFTLADKSMPSDSRTLEKLFWWLQTTELEKMLKTPSDPRWEEFYNWTIEQENAKATTKQTEEDSRAN